MSGWLGSTLGAVLGLALVGGVFWFVFRRPPERRSDGGLTQGEASNYASGDYYTFGDDNGHHPD